MAVYRVQKELVENGNGEASFDFSLITAFRVIEKVSGKYFDAGFGADGNQEHPKTTQEEIVEIIRSNPHVIRKELASLLDSTPYSIKYHLRQLTVNGVIKHEASTKAGKVDNYTEEKDYSKYRTL